MIEQPLDDNELYAFQENACDPDIDEARSMAKELLHLRAVVANAIQFIESGRIGIGYDVLKTKVIRNER